MTDKEAPKRSRWDDGDATPTPAAKKSRWDDGNATPTPAAKGKSRWDDGDATPTPAAKGKSRWDDGDATPTPAAKGARSRWDDGEATPTPAAHRSRWDDATPTPAAGRSRWDDAEATPIMTKGRWDDTTQTPVGAAGVGATPVMGETPSGMQTPAYGVTPMMTPSTPEAYMQLKWTKEIDERNRPLSDAELDAMLPTEGYQVLEPPTSYEPIRTPARKYTSTPTPYQGGGFSIAEEQAPNEEPALLDVPKSLGQNLPDLKPEDYNFFSQLLEPKDEDEMTPEELRDTIILKLLLKIKNGTPPQRKHALRRLTDKAREFGAGPLFDHILPLLLSPTLEDQERHLMVKVIDRILYKLDDLVRPYAHKILVVTEPMLVDEDYYARVEGREIIANLAKAAGLATMITTMRPDINDKDEFVRNVTARAFAVVASALGIPSLIQFLEAVCKSKYWEARHTGIKTVQQISILMGCAVLPHLKQLVELVSKGLDDEQQKVRTITALALASLAESSAPYGIEAFDVVLQPLWTGIHQHRGKGLAAFLKAIGMIIPLMQDDAAKYYTKEVMPILVREFRSPDEEMKKIVLKVVKQCVSSEGVERDYVMQQIVPQLFTNFWVKRMATDRRNYLYVIETTVEIANKIGGKEVIERIVEELKDENETFRRMVMECIELVIEKQGVVDIDSRLEERLIDGALYAFQEQNMDDNTAILTGFATIINSLGMRCKPYLAQVAGTIKWRLNNAAPKVRQQAADLLAKIAPVVKKCGEEAILLHMGTVFNESLGEEFPEVLGSVLGALKAIVNVVGMSSMQPPITDLLPRLTPILKNPHEKVQENCIDLVGRIADRGADYVNAREWMRICFELLELLKATKKAIRRAAMNTFGYIATAIGPSEVLVTLLNNLKVQERQLRVCTTVAIAIVAENCGPFTVIPALMNEYRVPELNVQNGVLKAMSFLFESIGEASKDYVYAIIPLLEDALMERDHVHRQLACNVVKHMSINVTGFGCEDALRHLLNYVWPNIFETSPHVINAVFEAVEGLRTGLGPTILLQYIVQGLFHPARKVRDVYWKLYNNLYIAHQDALVASYPRMQNDEYNTYTRSELEYHI